MTIYNVNNVNVIYNGIVSTYHNFVIYSSISDA